MLKLKKTIKHLMLHKIFHLKKVILFVSLKKYKKFDVADNFSI